MKVLKFIREYLKTETRYQSGFQKLVGKTGFEPATPWSQTRCATGLRYFPIRRGACPYRKLRGLVGPVPGMEVQM